MNQPKPQEGGRISFLRFFKSLRSHLPPIVLAVSLLGIYLGTIAPGLTWANGGSDGGDLITAAFTGGIAHPTGYPFYLLVARLFQYLPIGTLAFRTNLLSVTATILGAELVYLIVTNSVGSSPSIKHWPAGLSAGYAFGLAPLVWSQAVITEVYALQACLVSLILYLYTLPVQVSMPSKRRLDLWRGLVLGLGMANHVTTILLVPVALWAGTVDGLAVQREAACSKQHWLGDIKGVGGSLRRQLTWLGAGLGLYLIIPLRAFAHPPVNWGNPVTLERFWWLVSGGVYPGHYLQTSPADIWERLQAGASLLLQQFGLPGLLIGVIGLVVIFTPSRLTILTIWTAIASLAFAVLYGSVDSYVYLVTMCISFAIWIGLGVDGLARRFSVWSSKYGWGLGLVLIVYIAARSLTFTGQVDASQDHRAESFGREVLSIAPENALVFASGDRAVFALWYFHFALGERPDLTVLATDLLHFDWYQETLQVTYPALVVPGPFPWPETIVRANPTRAICYVQYSDHPEVDCSKPATSP